MKIFIIVVVGLLLLLLSIYFFHKVRNALIREKIYLKKYTPKYLLETIPDFIMIDLEIAIYLLTAAICLLLGAFFI